VPVLYCTIPYFAAALLQRDHAELVGLPLLLVGPEERVFGLSAQAAACGVLPGMAARAAQIRCPEARLLDADVARCRAELEAFIQLLEEASPRVEAHGWGSAYVELDVVQGQPAAVALCRDVGRKVRQHLGEALQPALGWNSCKFTAQAAARRVSPGHLRAVERAREKDFLRPLPVTLLPLAGDTLQRLSFLGLRTLGQYGALSPAAVWQQFGRAGILARRCARGEDDRPIIPGRQSPALAADLELPAPLAQREPLLLALRRLVAPLLAGLRENLRACGQVRLAVQFDDGTKQEQTRTFLFPLADEDRVVRALAGLLDGMRWSAAAAALSVVMEQIQDVVAEQLALFPLEDERQTKLREVQRYLAARFGSNCLRRAVLAQPGAPLPEWRVGWLDEAEP
jgi:nucleotidyltransferase/DNA polymerase involved in DNA repair